MNDEQAKNPFLIAGYEGSDYFCDRERETEKLIEAVNNGRNVTLLAARRIGKTGLIKHLFGKLRETGGWNVVYVDIYATQNLAEFTRKFAAAVIGSMDSSMEKALLVAAAFFKSFRPGITIDPLTGAGEGGDRRGLPVPARSGRGLKRPSVAQQASGGRIALRGCRRVRGL